MEISLCDTRRAASYKQIGPTSKERETHAQREREREAFAVGSLMKTCSFCLSVCLSVYEVLHRLPFLRLSEKEEEEQQQEEEERSRRCRT